MKIGFDNDKYLAMQSAHIRERIAQFDNKLYLEFGGKLFDDYHASRVLPGFQPDSKLQMLLQLKEQAEVVIVISAEDIVANKMRGDYGITYDVDVLRLIDAFQGVGLFVGSVCVTKYTDAPEVTAFEQKLNGLGIRTFRHYKIPGYPNDVAHIVSDDGYGKNDYIETERPLVVITAPGPGSGKMAVCLSQLYHEYKRGVKAGYAKFETFPIWNLPLKHPVNLAYEAATADLNDVNMIDPFHLEAYGKTTVNYNRDVEIFPVVNAMFELIAGRSPYRSPTDMGVNMAGNCIIDDDVCREASLNEIVRRYFKCLCDQKASGVVKPERFKLELLMNQAGIALGEREVEKRAHATSEATDGQPAAAIELADGTIVTGKTGPLLGAASSALLNALKKLAGIDQETDLVSARAIEPIQTLKTNYLGSKNPRLHTDEILIALSSSVSENEYAAKAMEQIPNLKGCDIHSTVILSSVDADTLKKLGWGATCLTEDMEFTMKLSLNDTRVAFAYDAVVYDEKPLTLKQSWRQRVRWMQGHCDVASRYFFKLIKKGIKERKLSCIDCAVYLVQPIRIIATGIITFFAYAQTFHPDGDLGFIQLSYIFGNSWLWNVIVILQFCYTPFVIWYERREFKPKMVFYYFTYILYNFTWVPIAIQGMIGKNKTEWSHTKHTRTISMEELNRLNSK